MMGKINCYPEMNAEIVKILRMCEGTKEERECIVDLYAAQLIDDLTRRLADAEQLIELYHNCAPANLAVADERYAEYTAEWVTP